MTGMTMLYAAATRIAATSHQFVEMTTNGHALLDRMCTDLMGGGRGYLVIKDDANGSQSISYMNGPRHLKYWRHDDGMVMLSVAGLSGNDDEPPATYNEEIAFGIRVDSIRYRLIGDGSARSIDITITLTSGNQHMEIVSGTPIYCWE